MLDQRNRNIARVHDEVAAHRKVSPVSRISSTQCQVHPSSPMPTSTAQLSALVGEARPCILILIMVEFHSRVGSHPDESLALMTTRSIQIRCLHFLLEVRKCQYSLVFVLFSLPPWLRQETRSFDRQSMAVGSPPLCFNSEICKLSILQCHNL